MNLKEIKDAARQAFSDQQTQDTEGGVPDIVSFCAGFLAGARHAQEVLDRADLMQTNREDVLPAAQEAAHYTWLDDKIREVELREVRANRLVVDLARQLTDLQRAFDDRVKVIEMQLEDKKKLQEEIDELKQKLEAEEAAFNAAYEATKKIGW
jgi:peptidoglycan hydrolase CwlO-like protein